MAAPRRRDRECCLPDGKTLRLPPIDLKSVPTHATIFKAKMHDDIVAMFNGSTTIRFDDTSLSSGVLSLKGDSFAFEALPPAEQPGNPMDLLFAIDHKTKIKLNGKITNTVNVERTKMKPNARRRRTSPPLQKKRSVQSLEESTNGESVTANGMSQLSKGPGAPKRQRISGNHNSSLSALRSAKPGARPPSVLNGLGASPFPSPHVSPGNHPLNGLRSKSRSSTPTPPNVPLSHSLGYGRNLARPLTSSTRTSPAQSASSPGSSAGSRTLTPEKEEKLRRGIIQLLALADTPLANLKKRLLDPRESPISDKTFGNIVRKVARYSKAGYVLKEECWDEVQENCELYSEADRKRMQEVLSKRKRKSSGTIVRAIRTSLGGGAEPAMIVDERSSHKTISQALERFGNRNKRVGAIRNAKEEKDARQLFTAYHSVYLQVNKRMEDVRAKMTSYHTRYNELSGHAQAELGAKIDEFFRETEDRHKEYTKYLPLLHRELKNILSRLKAYVASSNV